MTDALFEQYKDALRRGHVAGLQGRLDAAAAAYREAARIAPDRSLPYVGLGGVLARLGRSDDSLAAFAAALQRSPADDGAMRGRADVLAALGRRAEAAETLDHLADIFERDGRVADALDASRQAPELAESRGRRQHVERLVAGVRTAVPNDPAAAEALERAARLLDSVPKVDPRGDPPGLGDGGEIGGLSVPSAT
ncbi:MAG: tetratricopeptide repeat protein, partial [Solirubrobacterales bacterium]